MSKFSLEKRPGAKVGVDAADYLRVADALGVLPSRILAASAVESAGAGFLPDGRPKILFEGHLFHKFTKGKYSKSHPTISYPRWVKTHYKGGAKEYTRLAAALELDQEAALRATSFSRFQIIGDNYRLAGYKSVEEYVEAMFEDEDNSLEAFANFIKNTGLLVALRAGDWKTFARGYNGAGYRRNRYDEKLANADRKFGYANKTPRLPSSSLKKEANLVFPCAEAPNSSSALCPGTSLDDRFLSKKETSDPLLQTDSAAAESAAQNPSDPSATSSATASNSKNPSASSTEVSVPADEDGAEKSKPLIDTVFAPLQNIKNKLADLGCDIAAHLPRVAAAAKFVWRFLAAGLGASFLGLPVYAWLSITTLVVLIWYFRKPISRYAEQILRLRTPKPGSAAD